ncbi:hypothetical protein EV363DRAFT_1434611 [Boletus edulis]|uniref:Uncharacterized protein n=1 Tax=Boletus edulis BED1 TaxID=1328754 RepID=A0AAD4BYP9_BOLED|nr:hypothetical protein EV363DRAFT_75134 [Boletus edulis]KAF8125816.1 hypothetical protein EV363DRAFT_1434611 [Boletus edulis]KAF8443232.1 hypothetical protein L210DRAFT_195655 [Boletus edulis BED1]
MLPSNWGRGSSSWSHLAKFSNAHMPRWCQRADLFQRSRAGRSSSQEPRMASSSTSSGELRISLQCLFSPRAIPELSFPLAFSHLTYALVPETDVIIVLNNDLNPSNPNRASALLLESPLTCPETASTCAQLQETLLPSNKHSG